MEDQEIIKSHYNIRANKSMRERRNTKNINIRNANNFIKSCLIRKYVKRDDSVLDLGIGKGGDFHKYKNVHIRELYGIDIADRSILDATERVREGQYPFKITLKTKDAFAREFRLKKSFDVVSSQFAFHYAFSSEQVLDTTLKNINTHMNYGGYLILTTLDKNEILRRKTSGQLSNTYYRIEFKSSDAGQVYGNAYYYTLVDSVDSCVEYMVDMDELERKMGVIGFKLVERTSFEKFKEMEMAYMCDHSSHMHWTGLNSEEKSVFDLHIVVVFQKIK